MNLREQLIGFFARRHLLANFILLSVLIAGFVSWQRTPKEELPAVTFDTVRISVRYTGAPAEDVEYYVTRPIEEALRGLDGVYRLTSTSSVGQSNISVELEQDYPNIDEALLEIRAAVLDVDLPEEVIDEPTVRVFKTSKKAILDIALYREDADILTVDQRQELQAYALALENHLLNLAEVHSVERSGYLQEEIQVKTYPERLLRYEIPFNSIIREVRDNHIRRPAGTLSADQEPKVTLLSELNTPDRLRDLVVQGGFEGNVIRLGEIADVEAGFEKNETVYKVNGHEALIFNVVKSSSVGILSALDSVYAAVKQFQDGTLRNSPVTLTLLDDESIDVRNRLNLIGVNGVIGFLLILAILFIFLDRRSGFWVAIGIPFTLCFTMIVGSLMGLTINGTTLAAVIIVMGIVVDDAIIIAENISRTKRAGIPENQAVVSATAYMLLPITASIVTTCIAFIPLFFFQGHFGKFIEHIPYIVFLMLGASLLESLFILPGHMALHFPWTRRATNPEPDSHWFDYVERAYAATLRLLLPIRTPILLGFAALLIWSGYLVTEKMKFVMFPYEETRDIVLSGETAPGSTRYDTARKVHEVEQAFLPYLGKEVVGFRTEIARSRRGGAVAENSFRITVEILPKEKREKSSDQLIAEFQKHLDSLEGFQELTFRKSRWGQDSGSAVEIIVQQSNDELRRSAVNDLVAEMKKLPALNNVEIDEGFSVPEFRVALNREMIKRLSIDPVDVVSTFRGALEGIVLFEFSNGDENIYVRLTTVDSAKNDIERVLDIPVENRNNYLVPLRNIVSVTKLNSPNSIWRRNLKRSTLVLADIAKESKTTPLEIASELESKLFPAIEARYRSTNFSFGGEIQDSRESTDDFEQAALLVLLLTYVILAVLFNSTVKPLVIMTAIPFGIAGVIIAFYFHGKALFGFYACVGVLGLAGVVINDAIVMLVKLDDDFDFGAGRREARRQIASIASSRLRAVLLTTISTVVGILPTAYGWAGYDDTLAEMMLALTWGMIFGTLITLVLIPCLYSYGVSLRYLFRRSQGAVSTAALALVCLAAFSASDAQADEPPATNARILSVSEFIQLATSNDTEFEAILLDRLPLEYQKDLRLPARDIVLGIKQEYQLQLPDRNGAVQTGVSLSKLFPLSGTSISASYDVSESGSLDRRRSEIGVSVAQPIAENAFGRSTQLLDKIIGVELDVARHQIIEAYEDYFALLLSAYITWHEAYENLEIGRSSYRENQKLLDDIKSRQQRQIALPIDVNKIRLQVLAKQEKLVELEEAYDTALNVIQRSVRLPRTSVLRPREPVEYEKLPRGYDTEFLEFRTHGRTYQILDLLEKKSSLQVERDADALLPSVDLIGGYRLQGDDYDFDDNEHVLFAGVSIEIPFGNQQERARYAISRINARKQSLENTNLDFRLHTDTKNLYRQMQRDEKLVSISNEKIGLAQAVLSAETENYSFGKVTLNDYIDAVNVLDNNRFSKVARQARLRRLIVEWLRITDHLVKKDVVEAQTPSSGAYGKATAN